MEEIGVITKPQGIKGEFRIKLNIRSKTQLKKLKQVKINNELHEVEKVVFRDGFVIFKVKNIDDRNTVELLRNVKVYGELDYTTENGEVLINDIINFDVIVENINIGQLIDVLDYGAGEILLIKGNEEILIPNVRHVIKDIDLNKKLIILDKNIFDEIGVKN